MVTVICEREVTVGESPIGGLPKCYKFIRRGHTFGGCWLLLILMMVSTEKMCSVDHIIIVVYINDVAIGGLPKCPKFIRRGHTFGGCWLLLILMMVSTEKYVQLII